VLGFAYRPVRHDRLNTLVKCTYLYNVPTMDQITLKNTTAEFIQIDNLVVKTSGRGTHTCRRWNRQVAGRSTRDRPESGRSGANRPPP
jgi:hypothetical protein